jgi:nitrogen fixation/metabolism regulation signal transduction histidine kinase
MDVERLSEAFHDFTAASKSLETYYDLLREKVRYLTAELERKNRQLNEALDDAEKNREYLKAILYNLEETIIVVDPDNKITLVNKSAEKLLALDVSNVKGKTFNDLAMSITGAGSETFLMVDGKKHNIILSRSNIVYPDGRSMGTVILIKDITRLRELEIQQERNQRLIAMGEMSAKIVHEIRNPLCSIELFSSMLEKDLKNPGHRDLARGISTGIHNLNNILKNMLFFARPNKPLMKSINLGRVIGDSIAMFRLLIESRKIKVKESLLDHEIPGDAELLKQVFINMIINAVQSMPDGGRLDVIMKREEDAIMVDIRDTGEGIKQADMEKIFNPFFSTKDTGTGLGLAIASMIMQGHDGYIKVKSEEGNGSVFSLYFNATVCMRQTC